MKARTITSILILILTVLIVIVDCATTPQTIKEKEVVDQDVFFKSAMSGDVAEVKRLVEKGADINARDSKGRNAYMAASYYGHMKYDDDGKDVSVGYNYYFVEPHQIAATIYVYPTKAGDASTDLLKSHYQQVKNEILAFYKNVQFVLEQEDMFEFPSDERFGIWAGFVIEQQNEKKISYLFLFGETDWFIKVRISYPADIYGKEGVSNIIDSLVSSFDYSTIQ